MHTFDSFLHVRPTSGRAFVCANDLRMLIHLFITGHKIAASTPTNTRSLDILSGGGLIEGCSDGYRVTAAGRLLVERILDTTINIKPEPPVHKGGVMAITTHAEFLALLANSDVPHHLFVGLAEYVVGGEEPGDFLMAVFSNKLFEAVAQADDWSISGLPALVKWIYNVCPAACSGSPDKVAAWVARRGLRGE